MLLDSDAPFILLISEQINQPNLKRSNNMKLSAKIICGCYATVIPCRSLREARTKAKEWGATLPEGWPLYVQVYKTWTYREIYRPKNWRVPNGAWECVKVPMKNRDFPSKDLRKRVYGPRWGANPVGY